MNQQALRLETEHNLFRGDTSQTDDICIVGIQPF